MQELTDYYGVIIGSGMLNEKIEKKIQYTNLASRIKWIKQLITILFYIICSFIFLKPSGIDANGYHALNKFINLIQMIVTIFLIVKVFCLKNRKVSKLLFGEFLFFSTWLFCFFINESNVVGVIKIAITAMGFELLIEYTLLKNEFPVLIKSFVVMYIFLLSANLYLMIKNFGWINGITNSMYDHFSYLESDNGTNGYVQGSLLFGLLYSRIVNTKKYFPLIIILFLCILNEYRIWSASTVLGIFIFIIYFLFRKYFLKLKYSPLIIAISIYIGITYFRIQYIFSDIIVNYLHRDINMTGRPELWDRGLGMFKSSPIFGIGVVNYPLDNVTVQILVNGGIVLLIFFINLLVQVLKNINKPALIYNHLYRDSYFVFCIIIILSIVEAWINFKGFWIITSMFANLYYLDKYTLKSKEYS